MVGGRIGITLRNKEAVPSGEGHGGFNVNDERAIE